MEDDYDPITSKHFLHAFLVMVFVWGSLWSGITGYKMIVSSQFAHQNLSAVANYDGSIGANNTVETSLVVATSTNITNPKAVVSNSKKIKIMIAGDIMLDRGVRLLGEKYGYDSLFATITPLFAGADIVVANLEGPITNNKSKTVIGKNKTGPAMQFTFDPKSTSSLKKAGITVLSLANNHMDNFGLSGIRETRNNIEKAGLKWFGDPYNATSSVLKIDQDGYKFAFVGYHGFSKGFERIVDAVKVLKQDNYFVIVMPHWGEEYSSSTNATVINQARTLVGAGAGIIAGSHPHVVQERVWMGGVPVIYSLGNLLFDQHFSKAVDTGNVAEFDLISQNGNVSIEKARIYETSLASKRGIDVNYEGMDF